MGQIIGGAAKPKRCNINQLSQLGTPAAGEHILVSSDNSMNAAGQGNFDCYIVGDGATAAEQLELLPIPKGKISFTSRDAVSGKVLFDELHTIEHKENVATFTLGGFIQNDDTVRSNGSYYYIHDLDVSSFTKLYICSRQSANARNLLMDENHNILRNWQMTTSPYTEEIDLANDYPTAKYLSLSNYSNTDAYLHADVMDTIPTKTKLANLTNQVSELNEIKNGKMAVFEIPITIEVGYYNSSGVKVEGRNTCCTDVDISGYDLVVAYGDVYGNAYSCVYDENHNLLLAKTGANSSNTQVVFDIKNECPTAKYLCASSVSNTTLFVNGIKNTGLITDILMNVDEDYFLFKQRIVISKVDGYYSYNRKFNASTTNTSYKSNFIRVKEGMTFSLTSSGYASTLNYITYNANMEMVSIVKGQTYTSEQITIPAGIRYIEFFSYEDSVLVVTCDQLTYESSGGGGGNILAGKTYVAIGDSFTAPIGSEVIEGGRYDGQSKVYPYIIGNRNDMNVLNQGQSGSVLNGYLANARYNSIPAEVDYITIWYGINDWGHSISVGTIDDEPTTISAERDTTTCGGFNFFFKWLLTNRPLAHIGVIITDFCEQTRREAIMACCEKWGIPYLDLYDPTIPMIRTRGNTRYTHDTAIAPLGYVEVCAEAKALRNTIFSTDPANTNMHPNNTCHEWQSNLIEQFMRGL